MLYEIEDGPFATYFDHPSLEEIASASHEANSLAIEVIKRCNGSIVMASLILSGAMLVPIAMRVIMTPEKKEELLDLFVTALRADFEQVLLNWQDCVVCVDRRKPNERPS